MIKDKGVNQTFDMLYHYIDASVCLNTDSTLCKSIKISSADKRDKNTHLVPLLSKVRLETYKVNEHDQ